MITQQILEAISSRAEVLARRYYFLEKEDLIQDGIELVLRLEKKAYPEMRMHKAINNFFSNKERDAGFQQRAERNTSSFKFSPDTIENNMEEAIDNEEITLTFLRALDEREAMILCWLEDGWTIDQIRGILGTTRNGIRRIIKDVLNKRKKFEED